MTSQYKYRDIKLGILRVHIKKEFPSTLSHFGRTVGINGISGAL